MGVVMDVGFMHSAMLLVLMHALTSVLKEMVCHIDGNHDDGSCDNDSNGSCDNDFNGNCDDDSNGNCDDASDGNCNDDSNGNCDDASDDNCDDASDALPSHSKIRRKVTLL